MLSFRPSGTEQINANAINWNRETRHIITHSIHSIILQNITVIIKVVERLKAIYRQLNCSKIMCFIQMKYPYSV